MLQTLTIHGVKRVILDPIKDCCLDKPFFYRYIEVQDASGNSMQICLYSDSAAAIEINEVETKDKALTPAI